MKRDTYQSYLFNNSEEPVHNGLRIIVCRVKEGYMRRAHEKKPLTTKSCKGILINLVYLGYLVLFD
ncbi:TPA: hypothetical protein I1R63_000379 [Staphylococcus aureus]|nr:hypothetical protein [Staphylococcus aureus]